MNPPHPAEFTAPAGTLTPSPAAVDVRRHHREPKSVDNPPGVSCTLLVCAHARLRLAAFVAALPLAVRRRGARGRGDRAARRGPHGAHRRAGGPHVRHRHRPRARRRPRPRRRRGRPAGRRRRSPSCGAAAPRPCASGSSTSTASAVRDFDVTHEKRMHLILARRDLTGFQHLHPELGRRRHLVGRRRARRGRLLPAVRRLLARRRPPARSPPTCASTAPPTCARSPRRSRPRSATAATTSGSTPARRVRARRPTCGSRSPATARR